MNLLDRFNQRLGFTRSESLVVLFLAASLLLGGAVKITRTLTQGGHERYDYTKSDDEFSMRSASANLAESTDTDTGLRNSSKIKPDKRSRSSSPQKRKAPPETKINLNTANKEELMRLPGVGEVMAERIVMFREEHGSFNSIEELQEVSGIGRKKFERLSPYITVGQ